MPEPVKGTVVLDPGHGGSENVGGSSPNNAVSFRGVLEKAMTLEPAKLIREAILAANQSGSSDIRVVLTREEDVNLGLGARAVVAKSHAADLFLSIHCNGFDKQARGTETLIRPVADGNVNHAADKAFAQRIQKAVFETIQSFDPGAKDRGVKDQKLGVLNDAALGNTAGHAKCRACLVEIEFIDVEAVDELLNAGRDAPVVKAAIGKAVAAAIVEKLAS
jgi:N-acetylmuramoyl-L-alanine amidase